MSMIDWKPILLPVFSIHVCDVESIQKQTDFENVDIVCLTVQLVAQKPRFAYLCILEFFMRESS